MLNPDTRVAVVCYKGDQEQVEQMLDLYTHHERPVTILSPENSKVVIKHPQVENRHAGKQAQYGLDANQRMLAHMKILLEYPDQYFLMHESDSVCLDPRIPDYLYREREDVLFANCGHAMPYNAECSPEGCPALSFQAPWFMSRKVMETLVSVAPFVPRPVANNARGAVEWWVDLYLAQLTHEAGLGHKSFPDGYLGPVSGRYDEKTKMFFDPMPAHSEERGYYLDLNAPLKPYSDYLVGAYGDNLRKAMHRVNEGAVMIHSVKNGVIAHTLATAHERWKNPPGPPKLKNPQA